jgi:hypothetical protein
MKNIHGWNTVSKMTQFIVSRVDILIKHLKRLKTILSLMDHEIGKI